MKDVKNDKMINILVCNQKGGVGKSLIADEIAFSLERSGIPFNFFDLDSQGGTIHKSSENEQAKVAVIDTPGALQPQLKEWIEAADVVVIPTKTSSRDLEPLLRMQKAVKGHKNVVYVLNGWNARFRASNDFFDWLQENNEEKRPVLKLPQSEQFIQAGAGGESIVDYAKTGNAVEAIMTICNSVRKMAGLPEEKTESKIN